MNGRKIDDNTLRAYLVIVGFASSLFSELAPAATLGGAALVMQPGGADVGDPARNNMKGKAVKQALAAWLNFAQGSVTWDELTPTGQTFAEAMEQVEAIILDPNSTHADYVLANSIAEAINLMDKNSPACAESEKGNGKSKK